MLGAVIGDICGSRFEWNNRKTDNPDSIRLIHPDCVFTDDSVLTVAVAEACLSGRDYAAAMKSWGRRYPEAGYGSGFLAWLWAKESRPYNSWGNGSAMRVSPVPPGCDNLEQCLAEAAASAAVTHNHPEGIKGAQAVAAAIFLARNGASRETIRHSLEERFDYDLQRTVASIRPGYSFKVSCQESVPEAIIAFLESRDYADALRTAISLGGDSDTLACIAGGIAEAFYGGLPEELVDFARQRLPAPMLAVADAFYVRFPRAALS